jgi:catechol 2,3-dioxygenase-like lactoylglutathione lyase family enzyme
MIRFPLRLFLVLSVSLLSVLRAADAPAGAAARPKILGIAHAAFRVSDVVRAQEFYAGFLGYAPLPGRAGAPAVSQWVKFNDRQAVELWPGELGAERDRLHHVAFEVEDADAMLAYLRSRGVAGLPPTATAPRSRTGDKAFSIRDPNGHEIEFVQYLPEGLMRRHQGKLLPDTRIAPRLSHVGVMVGEFAASMRFYGELLGFRETWRGSSGGKVLSWVNLQVPDGADYLEFMLYDRYPTAERLRTMHHLCLEVADVVRAGATLEARERPPGSKAPSAMRPGINGKRQINYYDPDGTRVEIMEPGTHDGQPRPPSSAPVPVAEPKPAATVP